MTCNYHASILWKITRSLNNSGVGGFRRRPAGLPPEDVGVPHSSTTPCPSRTDTALLVWTLKWSKSEGKKKRNEKRDPRRISHIREEPSWVKAFSKTLAHAYKETVMRITRLQCLRERERERERLSLFCASVKYLTKIESRNLHPGRKGDIRSKLHDMGSMQITKH